MDKKNKITSLNWDQFRALGNPDNVENDPIKDEDKEIEDFLPNEILRVHLDKKRRAGKVVTLIRGFEHMYQEDIDDLCTYLKSKCGVGGSSKNNEILLQGNHRDKVVELLQKRGAENIKKSGG